MRVKSKFIVVYVFKRILLPSCFVFLKCASALNYFFVEPYLDISAARPGPLGPSESLYVQFLPSANYHLLPWCYRTEASTQTCS